jgi:membrane fusion protein (multidrug efflux system)
MTSAARTGLPEETTTQGTPVAARPAVSRQKIVVGAAALIAATVGAIWYVTHRGLENTDDAQVDGDVVAVPARLGGIVSHVRFIENQRVKTGDLLAELEDAPVRAKLAEAEASLSQATATAAAMDAEVLVAEANAVGNKSVAEAGLRSAAVGVTSYDDQIRDAESAVKSSEASLAQASSDDDRGKSLYANASIAKAEMDRLDTTLSMAESNLAGAKARLSAARESVSQAKSKVVEASARVKQSSLVEPLIRQAQARAEAAHAQVETARAARDLALIDVSYTKILAPSDGVVSKKTINEGQSVAVGQSIVQVVTNHAWVTANFKETQVGQMRPGQAVEFTVDAYPGVKFQGDVESMSGATGARFTLLAPDNASGNFTKVVQRVPVRVHLHDAPAGYPLRPGMSVDLTVDTRK